MNSRASLFSLLFQFNSRASLVSLLFQFNSRASLVSLLFQFNSRASLFSSLFQFNSRASLFSLLFQFTVCSVVSHFSKRQCSGSSSYDQRHASPFSFGLERTQSRGFFCCPLSVNGKTCLKVHLHETFFYFK